MNALRFHTQGLAGAARSLHWAELTRHHFGDLELDDTVDGDWPAQLSAFQLGDLRLSLLDTPPHRVVRRAHHREDALDESFKLVLQCRGRARIELGARRVELRPGDWSLYDPRRPYAIEQQGMARFLVVQLPRRLLQGVKVPDLHTGDTPQPGGAGLSALLGQFLGALVGQLPVLGEHAAPVVRDNLLGLLGTLLSEQEAQAPRAAALASVFKLRVQQHVQTHLSDPDLTLDRIAAELRCSKRYLHRVFEDEDCTLDRYIWRERLERARRLLTDPAVAERRPVAEIARLCGFRSDAHFGRQFKAAFGVSPSAWRRQGGHTDMHTLLTSV